MTPAKRMPRAALLLLLCGLGSCGSEPERGPNVLFVTLDTTRADYLGTYASVHGPTPAFDALAERGVRFEQAISSSALTPVSHASMLTGLFPYRHGLRVLSAGSGYRLPEDVPLVTSILREAGYRTAAVHSAFPVSAHFGFDRGFEHFDGVDGELDVDGRSWDVDRAQRRSDETTDLALDALDAVQGPGPFFLWVHYWDPHDPRLLPPAEWLEGISTERESDELYAAEVHYLDSQFARLLEGLAERGLAADTLVVVVSDHGEGLSDGLKRHGWGSHRMLYQEQIRVPLILAGPGVPAGLAVDSVVRTVDLAPTVLDYVGLATPPDLDGRSLRASIEGTDTEPRVAYADQINAYDHNAGMVKRRPDAAFLFSVISGRWKLIYRPHVPASERTELFDLEADPLELCDLSDDQPEVLIRLLDDLGRRRPWVLGPFPSTGEEGSAAAERALEALGYTSTEDEDPTWRWSWTCPAHPEALSASSAPHAKDCALAPIPFAEQE